jgi:hypothetical protein
VIFTVVQVYVVNPAVLTDVVQSHALSTYQYLNAFKCASVPVATKESDHVGHCNILFVIEIEGTVESI